MCTLVFPNESASRRLDLLAEIRATHSMQHTVRTEAKPFKRIQFLSNKFLDFLDTNLSNQLISQLK